MPQPPERDKAVQAYYAYTTLRSFRDSKGYLETALHDLQKHERLTFSAERLLALLHECDEYLDTAMEWSEGLAKGLLGKSGE